jgi:DHA1 family bicyclomycin/chloramphenicol resistance-like MFS transporter
MATHPMGHISGVATSVISAAQTFISVTVGATIGHFYDGTVQPLVLGFLITSSLTLVLVTGIQKR